MDGFRCLCFMAVFLFHNDFERFWYGAHGLSAFFVLSGFLITRVLLEGESVGRGRVLYRFYVRRMLRIFPLYYLLLLLLLAAEKLPLAPWHFAFLFNVKAFFVSLSGQPLSLRGLHLWTLCVEEQFYLLYPLLILGVGHALRPLLLGVMLFGSIASRLILVAWAPCPFYGALPVVAGEYILWGCLAYTLYARGWRLSTSRALAAGVALFASLVVVRPEGRAASVVVFHPFQTAYALSFALVILGLWCDEGSMVTRVLSLPPLVYLGQISYGLYVIHPLTWPIVKQLTGAPSYEVTSSALAARLLLTVAAASLSWHLLEAPVQRLKRHFPLLNRERCRLGGPLDRP